MFLWHKLLVLAPHRLLLHVSSRYHSCFTDSPPACELMMWNENVSRPPLENMHAHTCAHALMCTSRYRKSYVALAGSRSRRVALDGSRSR